MKKTWKWIKVDVEKLKKVVAASVTMHDILRGMGYDITGAAHERVKKAIAKNKISTDHLLGKSWSKGKTVIQEPTVSKYTVEEIFSESSPVAVSYIRTLIIKNKLKEYACAGDGCMIFDWHGKPLSLQLDHINGNRKDNRLTNLRWLCPNCHSQTTTFCSKNRKVEKYSDEKILSLCKKHKNIRGVVIALGCNERLYPRIRKIAEANGVKF